MRPTTHDGGRFRNDVLRGCGGSTSSTKARLLEASARPLAEEAAMTRLGRLAGGERLRSVSFVAREGTNNSGENYFLCYCPPMTSGIRRGRRGDTMSSVTIRLLPRTPPRTTLRNTAAALRAILQADIALRDAHLELFSDSASGLRLTAAAWWENELLQSAQLVELARRYARRCVYAKANSTRRASSIWVTRSVAGV